MVENRALLQSCLRKPPNPSLKLLRNLKRMTPTMTTPCLRVSCLTQPPRVMRGCLLWALLPVQLSPVLAAFQSCRLVVFGEQHGSQLAIICHAYINYTVNIRACVPCVHVCMQPLQAKAAEVMKRTAHINPTEQNKMTAKKNKNKKDEEKEEEEQDSGEDCKPKRKGRKPKEPKEPKAKAKGRAKKQEKKEQEGGKKEPENSTRESKSKGRKDGRDNQKVCKGKEEKETAEEKVRKGKEKDASKDESRKGKGKRTNKQHEQEKEHTAGEKTAVPEGQDQPVAARNGRKKKEYETQEAAQAAAKRSRKCCAYGAEYRKQLEIHGEVEARKRARLVSSLYYAHVLASTFFKFVHAWPASLYTSVREAW